MRAVGAAEHSWVFGGDVGAGARERVWWSWDILYFVTFMVSAA